MTNLGDKEQKEIVKQAIKEWMDERYADLGRWLLSRLLVAGLTSFLFWYISVRGYKFP